MSYLRPATLLKKRLWHRCFPVNFVKFLRTPFLTEHLWWFVLYTKLSLGIFQQQRGREYAIFSNLHIVWVLEANVDVNICRKFLSFFYRRSNLMRMARLKLVKNKDKLRTFWGWELQKPKTIIPMIYISYKNLLTEEWPEHHPYKFDILNLHEFC